MNKAITVLTLTKGRPNLVRRCIKSVSEQDYEGEVRHLILIDDCPDTYGTLQQGTHLQANIYAPGICTRLGDKSSCKNKIS